MSWSKGTASKWTTVIGLALIASLFVAAIRSGRRREAWHSLDHDVDHHAVDHHDEGP